MGPDLGPDGTYFSFKMMMIETDPKAYLAPLEAPPPERLETPPARIKPNAPPEQRTAPAPDEEVFQEYPDEFLEEPGPDPAPPAEPADAPEPEPTAESPTAELAQEPPMVLSRELLEPFIAEVLKRAYREGLSLNEATPKAIQKRSDETVYHLLDKGEAWAISEIGLRAAQLHALILQSKERGKPK